MASDDDLEDLAGEPPDGAHCSEGDRVHRGPAHEQQVQAHDGQQDRAAEGSEKRVQGQGYRVQEPVMVGADVLVHRGLKSLEDLLQAEVSDLAEIPELAEQASAIIEAVKAEAARRNLKVDETPVA